MKTVRYYDKYLTVFNTHTIEAFCVAVMLEALTHDIQQIWAVLADLDIHIVKHTRCLVLITSMQIKTQQWVIKIGGKQQSTVG